MTCQDPGCPIHGSGSAWCTEHDKHPDRDLVEAIRAKYAHYGATENLKQGTAVSHIRQLLDELDRLHPISEDL